MGPRRDRRLGAVPRPGAPARLRDAGLQRAAHDRDRLGLAPDPVRQDRRGRRGNVGAGRHADPLALVLPLAGVSYTFTRVAGRIGTGAWGWSSGAPLRRALVVAVIGRNCRGRSVRALPERRLQADPAGRARDGPGRRAADRRRAERSPVAHRGARAGSRRRSEQALGCAAGAGRGEARTERADDAGAGLDDAPTATDDHDPTDDRDHADRDRRPRRPGPRPRTEHRARGDDTDRDDARPRPRRRPTTTTTTTTETTP